MPTTTPSDEEKALFLLSGVVTFNGIQWISTPSKSPGQDCWTCPHGSQSFLKDCDSFIGAIFEHYSTRIHDICPAGIQWTRLKPEPSSS